MEKHKYFLGVEDIYFLRKFSSPSKNMYLISSKKQVSWNVELQGFPLNKAIKLEVNSPIEKINIIGW